MSSQRESRVTSCLAKQKKNGQWRSSDKQRWGGIFISFILLLLLGVSSLQAQGEKPIPVKIKVSQTADEGALEGGSVTVAGTTFSVSDDQPSTSGTIQVQKGQSFSISYSGSHGDPASSQCYLRVELEVDHCDYEIFEGEEKKGKTTSYEGVLSIGEDTWRPTSEDNLSVGPPDESEENDPGNSNAPDFDNCQTCNGGGGGPNGPPNPNGPPPTPPNTDSHVDISYGVGRGSGGISLGHIKTRLPVGTVSGGFTRNMFDFVPGRSLDAEPIYVSGAIKQVYGPDGLTQFDELSGGIVEVKFYPLSAVGAKVGGLYTITGTEHTTYRIAPNNRFGADGFIYSITKNGQTVTHEYYSTPSPSGKVTYEVLPDGKIIERTTTQVVDTNTTIWTRNVQTREMVVINSNEVVISDLIEEYASRGYGEFLDRRIIDPNGDNLITEYSYYEDINDEDTFGRTKHIIEPTGNWVKYEYNALGQVVKEYRPWKDLPVDPDTATTPNSRTITREYDYQGNLFEEAEFVHGVQIRKMAVVETPSDVEYDGPTTRDLYTVTREYSHGNGTGANWKVDSVSYLADLSGVNPRKGALYRQVRATGVATRQSELKGTFVGGVFNESPTGTFTQQIVTEGTLNDIPGVANTTTRTITVGDFKGPHRVVMEVYTGSGYEKISETTYTYENGEQRRLLSRSVDGDEVETWSYDGTSEVTHTDSLGVQTTSTYDDSGKLIEVVKAGVAADVNGAGNEAQADIVTTYETAGLVSTTTLAVGALTQGSSSEVDYAGRTVSQTDQLGRTIASVYTSGGRVMTETLPGGVTRIATYYVDRQLKSITGAGVVAEFHDYAVDGSGHIVHTVYYGTGDNTSPRWKKTVTNGLNQIRREETPGPNGLPIIVEYDYENGTGLRNKRQQTGLADTLYSYDVLGRMIRQGMDISGNGSLNAISNDSLTVRALGYEKDGNGDWWQVSTMGRYLTDDDDQDVAATTTRSKLETGLGSVVETTGPDGNTTVAVTVVDRANKTATITTTSALSSVSAVQVQVNGLLISQSSMTVSAPAFYRYDDLGRQTHLIDPRTNEATITQFNSLGQMESMTDAEGKTTTYTYYGNSHANAGMLASQTNQEGEVVRYAYDNLGRTTHQWGGGNYPLSYSYNAYGDRTQLRTYRGTGDWSNTNLPASFGSGASSVTTWDYHLGSGLLTSKSDDNSEAVTYSYKDNGLLDTRTWARGVVTTYDYDVAGRRILMNYSDGTPVVTIGYRRDGQRVTNTDAAGSHVYTYHAGLRALASQTVTGGLQDGLALAWTVDASGRFNGYSATLDSTPLNAVSYGYDAVSRLNSVSAGTQSAEYGYVADSDLLHTTTFKSSTITRLTGTRVYDDANRLSSISWVNSATVNVSSHTYEYDGAHRRERADQADGSYWEYGYNDKGEVTSAVKKNAAGVVYPGLSNGYTFDEIGNRLTATVDAEGGGVRTTSYTPNGLNQYSAITHPSAFDVTGSAVETAVVKVNTLSTQRQGKYFRKELAASNSGQPVWANVDIEVRLPGAGVGGGDIVTFRNGHRYVAPTPESPAYDEDGNLVSDGRWLYTWDGENRLIAMETTSSAVAIGIPKRKLMFAYDGGSRRIAKQVYHWDGGTSSWTLDSERRFIYDQWNLMAEMDGNGNLIKSHVWGLDESQTMQEAGGVGGLLWSADHSGSGTLEHFAAYDGNGNVTALVNVSTGEREARYDYDAFGQTMLVEGGAVAQSNAYRFSTKYEDAETDLYYYGFRYYSAELGRWLNRDPIEEQGGVNLYGMVANGAINKIDALGLEVVTVKKCEIKIVMQHGAPNEPLDWNMDPCSAGAAITCYPATNNQNIPENQRIPGTPTHDDQMFNEGYWDPTIDAMNDYPDGDKTRRPFRPDDEHGMETALYNVIANVMEKVRELCDKGCCSSIKLIIENKNSSTTTRGPEKGKTWTFTIGCPKI